MPRAMFRRAGALRVGVVADRPSDREPRVDVLAVRPSTCVVRVVALAERLSARESRGLSSGFRKIEQATEPIARTR